MEAVKGLFVDAILTTEWQRKFCTEAKLWNRSALPMVRSDCVLSIRSERSFTMLVKRTAISEAIISELKAVGDDRSFLFVGYGAITFERGTGLDHSLVQNNYSKSSTNVSRNLHCQIKQPQENLVCVVKKEMHDVEVFA